MKAICLLIVALGLPAPLFAATARELFASGSKALTAGKAEEALSDFEAAYAAQPSPSLLFWLGEAERAVGHKEKAAGYYRRYLKEEPDGAKKADAQARLVELKKAPAEHDAKGRGLALEELDLSAPGESPAPKAEVSSSRRKKSRKKGSSRRHEKTASETAPPAPPPLPLALPAAQTPPAIAAAPAPAVPEAQTKLVQPPPPAVAPAPAVSPAPVVSRPPAVSAAPSVAPAPAPSRPFAVSTPPPAPKAPAAASRPPAVRATPPKAQKAAEAAPPERTLIYVEYTGRLLSPNGPLMLNYATTSSPGSAGTLYTHGLSVGAQTEHFKNGVYLGFGTEFGGAFGTGTDTLLRYELSWECLWTPLGAGALLSPQVGFRLGGMGVKSERLTGGDLKPGIVVAALAGLNLNLSRWFALTSGIGYDANLGPDLGPTASVSGYSFDFGGAIRF